MTLNIIIGITRIGDVSMGTFSPFSLEDTYWSVYFDGSDDELNLNKYSYNWDWQFYNGNVGISS